MQNINEIFSKQKNSGSCILPTTTETDDISKNQIMIFLTKKALT